MARNGNRQKNDENVASQESVRARDAKPKKKYFLKA